MKANLVFLLTTVFLFSCSKKSDISESQPQLLNSREAFVPEAVSSSDAAGASYSSQPMTKQLHSEVGTQSSTTIEKKLIKNGGITFQVGSLSEQTSALKFVKNAAQDFKVTFDREDQNKWENQSSITLVARIPAESFDSFVEAITKGQYTVTNRFSNVTEVTEQYIDLEIRLKNKKELLEKYRSILKLAVKIEDILKINKSIESVTSEIESIEGQFKYLKNQIAMSIYTIQITAILPVTQGLRTGFFQDVKVALYDGILSVRNLILDVISLWPLILLVIFIIFVFIKFYKRKRLDD